MSINLKNSLTATGKIRFLAIFGNDKSYFIIYMNNVNKHKQEWPAIEESMAWVEHMPFITFDTMTHSTIPMKSVSTPTHIWRRRQNDWPEKQIESALENLYTSNYWIATATPLKIKDDSYVLVFLDLQVVGVSKIEEHLEIRQTTI